ncbi:MAG: hypothetical protein ACP5G7_11800 [Anaerolineae bacterium]
MSAKRIATRHRKWLLPAVFVLGLALGLALSTAMGIPEPVDGAASPTATARPTVAATPSLEPTDTPIPTVTMTPSPSPTAMPSPTTTATRTPTLRPTLADTTAPTNSALVNTATPFESPPTPRSDSFYIDGINLAATSEPLTISYPTDWARSDWLTLEGVDILVSDATGANLRLFNDIGSWVPDHKIFVYADGLTGVPILSIHDGYWSRRPLEAEPLRELIEGSVRSPYDLATIKANLERLQGHPVTFGQGGSEATFLVRDALRMDAETTNAYLYKPGRVSELFPEGQVTQETLIVLICSARQPDEPDETFPARFLILLAYVPD